MNNSRYVIAFNDMQKQGYLNFGVLPDSFPTLEAAKIAMAHRAEEVLDELVTIDAEEGREAGNYEIQPDSDGESTAVIEPDGGIMGQRRIHTILTIQTIVV